MNLIFYFNNIIQIWENRAVPFLFIWAIKIYSINCAYSAFGTPLILLPSYFLVCLSFPIFSFWNISYICLLFIKHILSCSSKKLKEGYMFLPYFYKQHCEVGLAYEEMTDPRSPNEFNSELWLGIWTQVCKYNTIYFIMLCYQSLRKKCNNIQNIVQINKIGFYCFVKDLKSHPQGVWAM